MELQYYAGGGGGGGQASKGGNGGSSIGGYGWGQPNPPGATTSLPIHGSSNTGSGGGAVGKNVPQVISADDYAGNGSSGVAIIRYKIQQTDTNTAKASGGAISFYNSKTIHVFQGSGTFTAPGSFSETVEYLVVAGGGGGSADDATGGGGGAGGYRTGTTPISGPSTTTIQVGGGGVGGLGKSGRGTGFVGNPSYFGTLYIYRWWSRRNSKCWWWKWWFWWRRM